MSLAAKSLAIALTQNGVEEVPRGSNAGKDVEAYLKSVGLGKGYPWCMAFVFWCVNKASAELGQANPLVKTGGVMRQWNETTLRKLPKTAIAAVRPGDIFIMDFGGGVGHTGFVEKIIGSNVYTIEGNTNDDGSREGYEVARRVRPASSFKGFIQLN